MGGHCLNIVLVEGSDGTETLTRADVALGPAHAAVLQMALYLIFVVHFEARVVPCSHGRV